MEIKLPDQIEKAVLGEGYNKETEDFVSECATGTVEFVDIQESNVNFSRSISQTKLADSLGFAAGSKARYEVTNGSVSAKFVSEASANEYSEVTIYSAQYRFKNKKLKFTGLTDIGKQAKDPNKDLFVGENWKLVCGHEYVEQITLGAAIYVSAKIEFSSKAEKDSFNAQFQINGSAFEVNAALIKASKHFGSKASVTIQAYQLGGDASRLSAIFGSTNTTNPSAETTHALLRCSLSNPDDCLEILTRAINYATDINDPHAFPQQIKPNLATNDARGLAELSYITSPWPDLSLIPPSVIIERSIQAARDELSFEFEKNFTYRNRVQALLTGLMRLSERQRRNIETIDQQVTFNLDLIQKAASICYADLDKCVEEVSKTKLKLKVIDETSLDIFPETIAQWYEIKDLPETRKDIQETLNILINTAKGVVNDFDNVEDKAATLEQVLLSMPFLDLYETNIQNLEPLSSLVNLVSLDLGSNQINDISPLSSLVNLTGLGLHDNQISDISPLSLLIHLNELDLNDNQISNISPLSPLIHLNKLDLNSNKISNISPLSSLVNLTWLGLYNNKISNATPLSSLVKLTNLGLVGNQISNVSSLSPLVNLEELFLHRNQISDISPLSSLVNLTSLGLWGNQISNIKPLSSLVNLKELFLHGNKISDVRPLSSLIHLNNLGLYDNQISNITPLSSLVNLTWLGLNGNKISDVRSLSSLVNLTSLGLDSNKISNVRPLSSLIHLNDCGLNGNQISDVSPLSTLINLTWLGLCNNQISDVSPLSSLVNLTRLDLTNNQISHVSSLSSLVHLISLGLDGNQISDISALSSPTHLTWLM